uniref:Uncharacterized protein n=1 Tax=Arundo donax TaxID=35708 RepID=A0A0A9HBN0_ARUDO
MLMMGGPIHWSIFLNCMPSATTIITVFVNLRNFLLRRTKFNHEFTVV